MASKGDSRILKKCPEAPEWLGEEARAHFNWIVPLLVKDRVVKAIDVPLVAAACDFYVRFKKAEDIDDRKKAIQMYEKIMEAYGMTFKARSMLKMEKSFAGDREDLDFGEFLNE